MTQLKSMVASVPQLPENVDTLPLVSDEWAILDACVPLEGARIIELGCGPARMARTLLAQYPGAQVVALEVDERQHAKNLAQPLEGLTFVAAGAQNIPFEAAQFDGALMLKSLHHVPHADMARALDEVARVLKPGGWLYVSEPVYGGTFNEIVKCFNDEGVVRAQAQAALDAALQTPHWRAGPVHCFATAVSYSGFEAFDQRMMRPTFADHGIDEAKRAHVRAVFEPHMRADGARFVRPMHVRMLWRTQAPV